MNELTPQQRVNESTTLLDLCNTLNNLRREIYEAKQAGEHPLDLDDIIDLSDLPTFGENRNAPIHTHGIFSWDDKACIIEGSEFIDDWWEITSR